MKLGKKLRRKLMTALGLGQDDAQRLLAQQQADEREALTVRSYRRLPSQQHEGHSRPQPQGPSRLQHWRM